MQTGYKDYIVEAFNARPIGLWIPPNWIGIGVFGLLGLVNPGFLVLGAGLELGYLFTLATHPRFQKLIKARQDYQINQQQYEKLSAWLDQLESDDQDLYRNLEERCGNILGQLSSTETIPAVTAQSDGLRRLLWIFLKLLLTRQSIRQALRESIGTERMTLEDRIKHLEDKLKTSTISEELRKSLTGQISILQQRQEKQKEARDKLVFLDAELVRIKEQVELLREQSVLSSSPETVSQRIDQISQTLGDTTRWIQEQQRIYGSVEDLLSEPPPLPIPAEETKVTE